MFSCTLFAMFLLTVHHRWKQIFLLYRYYLYLFLFYDIFMFTVQHKNNILPANIMQMQSYSAIVDIGTHKNTFKFIFR
jgi:hypothetical protein